MDKHIDMPITIVFMGDSITEGSMFTILSGGQSGWLARFVQA